MRSDATDGEAHQPLRNPLLHPLFQMLDAVDMDFSLIAGLPESWREPNASWRRMLPTQPAIVATAYIELWGLADFWCGWYSQKTVPAFTYENPRVGQLFDRLDHEFGRFPYSRKRIVILGLG